MGTATADPDRKTRSHPSKPRLAPRHHVVLWNDDDHTFEYVERMMANLFAYPQQQGQQIALTVHTRGRAIVLTTTFEHAELKRDQIHAFGRDQLVARCIGSMSATIEAVP